MSLDLRGAAHLQQPSGTTRSSKRKGGTRHQTTSYTAAAAVAASQAAAVLPLLLAVAAGAATWQIARRLLGMDCTAIRDAVQHMHQVWVIAWQQQQHQPVCCSWVRSGVR